MPSVSPSTYAAPCLIPGAIAREEFQIRAFRRDQRVREPEHKGRVGAGPDRDPSAKSPALSVQPHVGVFDALGVLRAVLD